MPGAFLFVCVNGYAVDSDWLRALFYFVLSTHALHLDITFQSYGSKNKCVNAAEKAVTYDFLK